MDERVIVQLYLVGAVSIILLARWWVRRATAADPAARAPDDDPLAVAWLAAGEAGVLRLAVIELGLAGFIVPKHSLLPRGPAKDESGLSPGAKLVNLHQDRVPAASQLFDLRKKPDVRAFLDGINARWHACGMTHLRRTRFRATFVSWLVIVLLCGGGFLGMCVFALSGHTSVLLLITGFVARLAIRLPRLTAAGRSHLRALTAAHVRPPAAMPANGSGQKPVPDLMAVALFGQRALTGSTQESFNEVFERAAKGWRAGLLGTGPLTTCGSASAHSCGSCDTSPSGV